MMRRPKTEDCYDSPVAVGQTIAASGNRGPLPRSAGGGGKSELRRAVRRVTPGQGNLTDQWHRKNTALGNRGKGEKVR